MFVWLVPWNFEEFWDEYGEETKEIKVKCGINLIRMFVEGNKNK